ncbi:SpoIIAA family protein [Jannaschia ovalis]|uniref:STAS/SEC14 domain-containing protein n=1 Tax=Jannaschia ovalis TaxID=3038773 RepID=A0ABY8LDC0_9RHOB|nr:STAS/SEC14 domain-containing protein [Jannaschia sp. GRR-S6-38]WGH79313.1 STAS/SEC14 domain-containing protein [Jannaschia sp. GRR-S6-38]
MLTVEKPSPNRVDLHLRGALNSETMRAALDDFVAACEGVEKGRMIYEIADFKLPTLGALVVELSRLPELFGLLRRFHKCAVLCDTDWIRSAADFEGDLLPGVQVRTYKTAQRREAEAWLDDV